MGIELLIGAGGVFFGGLLAYLLARPKSKIIEETAKKEVERLRKNAENDAERIVSDGRAQVSNLRENARKEETQMRERLERIQNQADERISKREEVLEQKIEKSETARENYEKTKKEFEEQEKELQKSLDEQNEKLAEISGLSKKDAEKKLLERLEKEIAPKLDETRHKKVELMRQAADEESTNIIVQSIQRYSSSVTNESTISVVKLDSDDLKGKIIGREGRNINAFETITGVDLIVDDTPGTITISCFDMFRRYVAKIALENLIKDGRIHPSRIEESVKKAQESADKLILDIGKKVCYDLGVSGFPEQILKLIGRLRFRTSYGQNVLQHSIEVAYISEAMAAELPHVDPELCKKAGLVHDIGKAVSHEVEGGHAVIGADILKKFGVDEKIIIAMRSHHEDFPYESIESRVLQAADAISASRPGARRETMEKYLKRLRELETIAGSFPGVDKVFAIQAGREVRVFVNAQKVDDTTSEKLSFDIARKIEEGCEYPGEVKVAVIRENRFEQVAK
ncbi:MAG: ribonuclease Y [Candidatus Peregrinibacteria bacterium]|nr:ribonuclease Y [Candidatus Peregrinibacteria bacterium]